MLRLAPWTLLGAILILVAGLTDGARTWLWLAALAATYVGAALSGSTGWHLHPTHFAERHGLVLIIALGEAFISIGIGATGIGIGLGEVVAAILGLLVATSIWLAYFDFFSIRGERILGELQGAGTRGARPRRLHVRALPDDRRHRALRVRDEDHRRRMSARSSTPSRPSRYAAGARSTCSRTRRCGYGSNGG